MKLPMYNRIPGLNVRIPAKMKINILCLKKFKASHEFATFMLCLSTDLQIAKLFEYIMNNKLIFFHKTLTGKGALH